MARRPPNVHALSEVGGARIGRDVRRHLPASAQVRADVGPFHIRIAADPPPRVRFEARTVRPTAPPSGPTDTGTGKATSGRGLPAARQQPNAPRVRWGEGAVPRERAAPGTGARTVRGATSRRTGRTSSSWKATTTRPTGRHAIPVAIGAERAERSRAERRSDGDRRREPRRLQSPGLSSVTTPTDCGSD